MVRIRGTKNRRTMVREAEDRLVPELQGTALAEVAKHERCPRG
jgi:hypothetical protein